MKFWSPPNDNLRIPSEKEVKLLLILVGFFVASPNYIGSWENIAVRYLRGFSELNDLLL